ncbi:MAG: transcription-repair coupling factor [Alphaproteobacteria bacterium]|nr:transcription-repair coupling factor [Alphaproteobacteria bacterium]
MAGAPDGCSAIELARIAFDAPERPVLHIARDDAAMARLANALAFFAPNLTVMTFPAWDCLPYDRVSPNGEVIARRLDVLTRIATNNIPAPLLVLTTVSAAVQRVPARAVFEGATLGGKAGEQIEQSVLTSFFERNGYVRAGTVREAGEYALRGGIVDVFPPGAAMPLRLDFFGDELEGVRTFDAMTQRTEAAQDGFHFGPVSEVLLDDESVQRFRSGYRSLFGVTSNDDPLYESISAGRRYIGMEHWLPLFHEKLETFVEYLPNAAVSLDHDFEIVAKERFEMVDDYYEARRAMLNGAGGRSSEDKAMIYKPVPVASLFIDQAEWRGLLSERPVAEFTAFDAPQSADGALSIFDAGGQRSIDFTEARKVGGGDFLDVVRDRLSGETSRRILITGHSAGSRDRLRTLLTQHGVPIGETFDNWADVLAQAPGSISLATLDLDRGFMVDGVVVYTEQDILGERLSRPSRRRRRGEEFLTEASSLSEGDYVVHVDHGVGRFDGLETVEVGGAPHDCLRVHYHGDDKLFVPVENIEVLARYGSEDAVVHLDRLGGQAWQARKSRVKERIREIAHELLAIAAKRALSKGETIAVDDNAFQEFAARFPYDETDDQLGAITDVLSDIASGRPMDRLVCGDVGFGKTEIALRAAFAATMEGFQVAVVVPTTLLALQHHRNFVERFKGLPVRVGQLSRFVAGKDADRVRSELADGTLDIVIGTHSLLSDSVRFERLGLMVIDEEQHFGVAQKEKLKRLSANVHVLTLTATPIPRTLQMALSGVRELSIIATPPVDRLAIRSFVLPYDPVVVREAIMREHHRGGQTFYVCPRVADIRHVERRLKEMAPELRIAIAHGQMASADLEEVMARFSDGGFDVLLCTHIIESGLDLPKVNTMVIHRADMFGLAQLYQLRGRVGRSKIRAYCYFTVPPGKRLTPTAARRLEVMQTLDTLGAGFTLASHDLDIRGAGNLLGDEQSGHVREVGVELYQRMLEEAIVAARDDGGTTEETWTPQITVGASVLIPERYVEDLMVRLGLYRRLSHLGDAGEIDAFAAELVDRFGTLPDEVENLLEVMAIKQLCRRAGVEKFDAGPKGAVLAFRNNEFANPTGLIGYIQQNNTRIKLRPDQRVVYMDDWARASDRIAGVRTLMRKLVEIAER